MVVIVAVVLSCRDHVFDSCFLFFVLSSTYLVPSDLENSGISIRFPPWRSVSGCLPVCLSVSSPPPGISKFLPSRCCCFVRPSNALLGVAGSRSQGKKCSHWVQFQQITVGCISKYRGALIAEIYGWKCAVSEQWKTAQLSLTYQVQSYTICKC